MAWHWPVRYPRNVRFAGNAPWVQGDRHRALRGGCFSVNPARHTARTVRRATGRRTRWQRGLDVAILTVRPTQPAPAQPQRWRDRSEGTSPTITPSRRTTPVSRAANGGAPRTERLMCCRGGRWGVHPPSREKKRARGFCPSLPGDPGNTYSRGHKVRARAHIWGEEQSWSPDPNLSLQLCGAPRTCVLWRFPLQSAPRGVVTVTPTAIRTCVAGDWEVVFFFTHQVSRPLLTKVKQQLVHQLGNDVRQASPVHAFADLIVGNLSVSCRLLPTVLQALS